MGNAAIDRVLQDAVASGHVPGAVGLVTNRDKVLYQGAFGGLDASGHTPMTNDAVFRIKSMTKPVTSIGVMMLVDRGLVDLDAPAEEYLPSLAGREVVADLTAASFSSRPPSRPPTVRDLLRHTSGFGYAFSSATVAALLKRTGWSGRDLPLLHDPGACWTYGISAALLGDLIEKVSGESLAAFFRSRIFEPAGMNDSGFELPSTEFGRLAALYRRSQAGLQPVSGGDRYVPVHSGDGGLLSTAEDFGRFTRIVLGRGTVRGARVLSRRSLDEMTHNQLGDLRVEQQPTTDPSNALPFPDGAGQDEFGLGFQIHTGVEPGTRPPGSLSWSGFYNTHFWIDPVNQIAGVLMLQVLPFYDPRCMAVLKGFERAVYGNLRELRAGSRPERAGARR